MVSTNSSPRSTSPASLASSIPIIDLFAGPGGLGEGFSSILGSDGQPYFDLRLSVEKDPVAHQTLELRSFFRKFPRGDVPDDYYLFLQGKIDRATLYSRHAAQADAARHEAWNMELGSAQVKETELDDRIVRSVDGNPLWMLIGGPPCQAYSLAGRSRNKGIQGYRPEEDHRHFLYREYLRILAKHWPPVFVMENVKGILSSTVGGSPIFEQILQDLQDPSVACPQYGRSQYGGYRIYSLVKPATDFDIYGSPSHEPRDFIIEAEKYGIPQARHRVILLGVRRDIPEDPGILSPRQKPVSASQVLAGLPQLRSGLSKKPDSDDEWLRAVRKIATADLLEEIGAMGGVLVQKQVEQTVRRLSVSKFGRGNEFLEWTDTLQYERDWFIDPRLRGVCNSATRGHMVSDLHRYIYAACFAKVHSRSPRLADFPSLLHPEHKNVDRSMGHGNFSDRFRVQLEEQPSTTVVSHIAKDGHYYIHYDPKQCRSLTVREAARLQTFPDNYFFCGNRTEQYSQVGNAVPPLLSRQIAEVLRALLERVRARKSDGQDRSRATKLEYVEDQEYGHRA